MKCFLIFVMCFVIFLFSVILCEELCIGEQGICEEDIKAFQEWQQKFKKHYNTQKEEDEAMEKLLENKAKIDAHNKLYDEGLVRFRRGLWEHSDLSSDEKVRLLLGARVPQITGDGMEKDQPDCIKTSETNVTEAPEESDIVNWVKEGLVGPVESQGLCGSCWAFASKGVVEAILRRQNITVPVAPQQMIDCSKINCRGCDGGWPASALEYLRQNGFTSEYVYPYLGVDNICTYNSSEAIAVLNATYLVWTNGNENYLRDIVRTVGPVSVMMRIDESFYNYESGIYYDPECGMEVNHAMLMVGYGSDPYGGDYWLIKNSWGESWGELGYVRFARNKGNMCNIAHSATYATGNFTLSQTVP